MLAAPLSRDTRPLRTSLLRWYDRHYRALPWRTPPGAENSCRVPPYHVLVSEAMLHQTQVTTVLRYFPRFIEIFPTIETLATADEASVLQVWQGLGYYRRARNLQAAAKAIVKHFDGQIPSNIDQLRTLPGIGAYTAGAIASIAFGRRSAAVDGNVIRVLARLFVLKGPSNHPSMVSAAWQIAEHLVPPTRPGDFNQAMMDLGATICTPRNPRCSACPLQRRCLAFQSDMVDQLPERSTRSQPQSVRHHVLAISRSGRWVLRQRPKNGLWAGMWELPSVENQMKPTALSLKQWIHDNLGLTVTTPARLCTFKHRLTHRLVEFVLWVAVADAGRLRPSIGQWCTPTQISKVPLANPQRRAVALALGRNRTGELRQ